MAKEDPCRELVTLLTACDLTEGDRHDADLHAIARAADWLAAHAHPMAPVVRKWSRDKSVPHGDDAIGVGDPCDYGIHVIDHGSEDEPDRITHAWVRLFSWSLLAEHGTTEDSDLWDVDVLFEQREPTIRYVKWLAVCLMLGWNLDRLPGVVTTYETP